MSKLIDTDKLARLAKALDARAKAMVEAEKERAMAVEAALEGRIAANEAAIKEINNGESGIFKKAQEYADEKDAALKQELEGVIADLQADVDQNEADCDAAVKAEEERAMAKEGELLEAINKEKEDREQAVQDINDAMEQMEEDFNGAMQQEVTDREAADQAMANRMNKLVGEGVGAFEDDAQNVVSENSVVGKAIKELADRHDEEMADADGRLDALEADKPVQDAAIKANADAIGVLNGDENVEGSVKKQIKDAIDEVNSAASDLEDRVEALENDAPIKQAAIEKAQAAADKAQEEVDLVEERMSTAEGRLDDIDEELEAQDNAIKAAQAAADQAQREVDAAELKIKANEDAIGIINGGEDQEGSIAKAVKDAVDPVQADLDALEAVVGAPAEGEGVPATGLHKIVADGDAATLQAAKEYADQEIADLVDSAPETLDTLRELAEAIGAHQDVYDAYVAEMAAELAKKVDKVENHRLVSETEIAAWNAKAEVSDVEQALEDAKEYTDQEIAKVNGAADTLAGRVESLEEKVGHDVDGENPATGLFLEVDQAKAAADQAQVEVDACEGRLDAIEGEQDIQDGKIAANEAAIGVLNGGVDQEGSVAKSIADALEAYSTTEEMKTMLGNVVQSLALTMENDKVVLKLGGVDGIAITEVSLDMATDTDIDSIINGLDEEEQPEGE
jgi:chromosome segregation ATPase